MRGMGWAAGILLAVLATANLYVPDLGGGLLADPTTVVLGLTLVLAGRAWVLDRFRVGRPHAVIALVALTFVPGLVTAADHDYGQTKVLGLLATFAITGAAMQLLPPRHVRQVFVGALGVSGAVVAFGLLLFGETATYYGRASLFELNPISLARMAALGALVAALAAVRLRGRWRLVALAVAAVCSYAVYTTGSSGPVAAAVAAGAVLLARGRVHPSRRMVGASLVALVVAGVAVWASGFRFDGSGRGQIWADSLWLALRTPGGIGFGDLNGKIPLPYWAEATGDTQYAHNMLIEAMLEGGWIALVGLLVALGVSLRWLLRDRSWTGRAMLAVWVFAVVNASLSSDLVGNRLMWVMIGAGLALHAYDEAERPATGKSGGPSRLVGVDHEPEYRDRRRNS